MSNMLKNLDDFKNADQATRDYYVYDKLSNFSLEKLDKRYTRKWVETFFIWTGRIAGSAVITTLIILFIKNLKYIKS